MSNIINLTIDSAVIRNVMTLKVAVLALVTLMEMERETEIMIMMDFTVNVSVLDLRSVFLKCKSTDDVN